MEGHQKRPRLARLAIVTLAALAAIFAAQVSPAEAKAKPQVVRASAVCGLNAPGASLFSALSRLSPSNSFAARGSVDALRREPAARPGVFKGQQADHNGSNHEINTNWSGATVKIYYHVITNGTLGQVTDAMLAQQTKALNLTFAGRTVGTPMLRTGADLEVKFVIAGIDRTNNKDWYELNTFDDEINMKQALKKGGSTDLNVYTGTAAGYLGFAYYPDIVTDPDYSFLDGIVLNYRSMEGPTAYKNYGLGYTLTHETGHWFGLAHTFDDYGTCAPLADFVADTPDESEPTTGCPADNTKDSCPAPGWDPIHNYMDYSYDPCYTQFTDGQAERAADQYMFWRVHHGKTTKH